MFKSTNFLILLSILTLKNNVFAWSSPFENLGGVVDHVASASWGPGRVDIFGVGDDRAIWHKTFAKYVWSDWTSIGGSTASKISAFSLKPNWIDIMYTGTDQIMYRKTWDGSKWIDWTKSSNGGLFLSGPSIAASDSDYIHVFGIGIDSQLYTSIITISNNEWSTWEVLGGRLVGDPAAISWGPGRFDVFAIAPDNKLWQKTYDGSWKNWNAVSDENFQPGVGVTSKGPGIINVFMKGLDNSTYHRQFSNGDWGNVESVGGNIRGSPAGTAPTSSRVDVFFAGNIDRVVYHSIWETRISPEPLPFGCVRGYCYAQCDEALATPSKKDEWCYSRNSEGSEKVSCSTHQNCERQWKCATSCTV